ncbi:hypothetical protein GDO78_018167 [Eleutherodactylus coqui]|uniref:Uncharacterized protein n=1 Tax=Eleutherodactylus coqui TaxID=57060 RepID=A0A8J6EJF2_ELECQ|nr:hypothetical protein GDO78_018167 [Eleutherodactylus coqui]
MQGARRGTCTQRYCSILPGTELDQSQFMCILNNLRWNRCLLLQVLLYCALLSRTFSVYEEDLLIETDYRGDCRQNPIVNRRILSNSKYIQADHVIQNVKRK